MRRFLPAKFQLRERILSGLAIALAGVALYLVHTAAPRAAPITWLLLLFLGTVLFVAISGRDRAFFTGLYCTLLSAPVHIMVGVVGVVRIVEAPKWGTLKFELPGLLFGAFLFVLSIAIPVTFARCVNRLIDYLERKIYRQKS